MQITKKKLSDLRRNPNNIRKHSQKQIQEYIRSIKMFGQTRPMVVDENGLILAGNGLYDALSEMGADECDTYVMVGLTETQKNKLMLADNKVFELGISDLNTIESVVKSLGDDLDVPGYDDDVLKLITATVVEATEAVQDYGKIEPAKGIKFDEAAPISAESFGKTMQETGGVPTTPMAPNRNARDYTEADTANVDGVDDSEGKFIICPHCGGKICL